MAIIGLCGFETGDTVQAIGVAGTHAVQGTVKRTGAYALRCNPTTTGVGYVGLGGYNPKPAAYNAATAYYTFLFRYATKPASNSEPLFTAASTTGANKFHIRINSAGNLSAHNRFGTLMATGSTVLAVDTWYRIDAKVGTGASAAWEVRIDGVSEISGTGDLGAGNNGWGNFGKRLNANGNTVDFFYDDIVVSDSAYVSYTPAIWLLTVNGDGNYQQWSPKSAGAHYVELDETPSDGLSTYVEKVYTAGTFVDTCTLTSCAAAGVVGTPQLVFSGMLGADAAGLGTATGEVRLRSGSTDDDSATAALTVTFLLHAKIYTTDPADAAAWTTAKVNALEVGPKGVSTGAEYMICTTTWVHVVTDGVAPAAAFVPRVIVF